MTLEFLLVEDTIEAQLQSLASSALCVAGGGGWGGGGEESKDRRRKKKGRGSFVFLIAGFFVFDDCRGC